MEKENLEDYIKSLMELPDEELIKEMDAIIIALKKFIDSDEPTPEQKEILKSILEDLESSIITEDEIKESQRIDKS